MTRDQIDAVAWKSIHDRVPKRLASSRGCRPLNYKEIEEWLKAGGDFEHIWSDFLHAFYDYRDSVCFADPSPPSLSPGWQALLAGTAEFLSAEFSLVHPVWVDDRRYFLDQPWDPIEDYGLDMTDFIVDKLERSPEAFRRRNVAFLSRNLIAL